jgi:hypothetical protein
MASSSSEYPKVIIYILELEDGKYYVGRTKNLDKRFKDHVSGVGSSYTKKYKPIRIKESYHDMNPFDEDKFVIEYMHKYGIDNVRGGSYSMVNLSNIEIYAIKRKIWGALDLCFVCGRKHFSNRCVEELDIYGDEILKCKRCLRKGHLAHECIEDKNTFQKNIAKAPEEFEIENTANTKSSEDDNSCESHQPSKKSCCIIL